MRRCRITVLAGLVFAASAVGAEAQVRSPESSSSDTAALLRADSAFARDTEAMGAAGWAGWFAEDGSMVRGTGEIRGRGRIREVMEPLLSDPDLSFTWTPQRAIPPAGPGDLGATIGSYRLTRVDGTVVDRGMYMTLWHRQPDGGWKVVADIGSPAPSGGTGGG